MQPGKNLHLSDNWYHQVNHENNLYGPTEGVLLNFNSYGQGQLFLTRKLYLGGCSQEHAC